MDRFGKFLSCFTAFACRITFSLTTCFAFLFLLVLGGCSGASLALLEGWGTPALLSVKPAPYFENSQESQNTIYDFGSVLVEGKKEEVFRVTNQGLTRASQMSSTFSLSLHFQFAGGAYPGVQGNCGENLEPKESCFVVVRFLPRYVGQFEDSVKISYFNGKALRSTDEPVLRGRGVWGTPGALDETFSFAGGRRIFWEKQDEAIRAFALSDGTLLNVGTAYSQGRKAIAVVKYRSDGEIDTSFNGTGSVFVPFEGDKGNVTHAFLQPDGRLMILGRYVSARGRWVMSLTRLLQDGARDTSFGNLGVVEEEDPKRDLFPEAVMGLPDQRLVVAGAIKSGEEDSRLWIKVFKAQGEKDSSFGSYGELTLDAAPGEDRLWSLGFSRGKILAAGATVQGNQTKALVVSALLEGTWDISFGEAGLFADPFAELGDSAIFALKPLEDGKILLAGRANVTREESDFFLGRLLASGQWDLTFANAGKQLISLGDEPEEARALAVTRDGAIVLTGKTGSRLGVVRTNRDGTLDPSFGAQGKAIFPWDVLALEPRDLLLQANEKIVVSGRVATPEGTEFFLARFWP